MRDTGRVDFAPVESNLRDSFRAIAAGRAGGEVREYPGVSIASANVAFQMFNAAFLSGFVPDEADLERRIAMANVHFDGRGVSWAFWVCEDWLAPALRPRARQVFRRQGLRLSVEMPGMAAECVRPPAQPLPALEVLKVSNARTLGDFCAIGSMCFNVPIVWFREVFSEPAVWERFIGYVGYVDGEAVSTAATVTGSGVVGVYNVATAPGYQRRGFGEAVMRESLVRAGAGRSILQSTPQGYRLYERMGYRTVTRIAVYAS
ncbi:MAG: GNAT family N-acetyltransferase [Bryobacteraceae bacterium]